MIETPELPRHPFSKPGEPEYVWANAAADEKPANEAFSDLGGLEPAVLQLKLVAIFDALTFGQRENVLRKLGYEPVVKFYDETSGLWLKGHRYYGFYDAGGLAGDSDGYPTRESAIEAIGQEHDKSAIGTLPEQLGDAAVTVLSGNEFIAQLQKIDRLSTYGRLA